MITTSVQVVLPPLLRNRAAIPTAVERFFRQARVILAQDAAERFRTATDPQGNPWAPLSPRTLRRAVGLAIAKVGGRAARPQVRRTATGGLRVIARQPQSGYQRSAVVRRTKGSQILVDTGRLRNSVISSAATADAVRVQTQLSLVWGTRVPYASQHQQGDPTRNLPARPFLGISAQAQTRLQQALQRAFQSVR
jgi:phage gpG-like protein